MTPPDNGATGNATKSEGDDQGLERAAELHAKAANAEAGPLTKRVLLAKMRALEKRLYSNAAEKKVLPLSQAEKQDFIDKRATFTAAIARLNATLINDIADGLKRESASLDTGIANLNRDLAGLQNAAQWAGALNGILGTLGKVISLVG